MRVNVIKRGVLNSEYDNRDYSNIQVVSCGYLELDAPFSSDLWHLCNWSHWAEECPAECKHLLIDNCNSDVAFGISGVWYSHNMKQFNSFNDCYQALTTSKRNQFFDSCWPLADGFITEPEEDQIHFVTPSNVNSLL